MITMLLLLLRYAPSARDALFAMMLRRLSP